MEAYGHRSKSIPFSTQQWTMVLGIRGKHMKTKLSTKQTEIIGVRFANPPFKMYFYNCKHGVYLGQELVADTPHGPAVCFCVRLAVPEVEAEDYQPLKTISRGVSNL
jgi:hypothetical protein